MQEEELWRLCKDGDKNARKLLYELFAPTLFSIAMRYLGERELAQDILHDCFIKLFASLGKFTWRGAGSLKAWMCRVMVNMSIEHLKKNKKIIVDISYAENKYEEPEAELINDIPETILLKFISELPYGYRTVFNLFIFEEKSHKEIAELLKINEKSSASQLVRAKAALAKRIKEYKEKK